MPRASVAQIRVERGSYGDPPKLHCGECDRTVAIGENTVCPKCDEPISLVQLVKRMIEAGVGERDRQAIIREIKTRRFEPEVRQALKDAGWSFATLPEEFSLDQINQFFHLGEDGSTQVVINSPVGCFDISSRGGPPTEVAWKPGLEVDLKELNQLWEIPTVVPAALRDRPPHWVRAHVPTAAHLIYLLFRFYHKRLGQTAVPAYSRPILVCDGDRHDRSCGDGYQFLVSAQHHSEEPYQSPWIEFDIRRVPAQLVSYKTWRPTVPASTIPIIYPYSLFSG